jgi:hypothetical protein
MLEGAAVRVAIDLLQMPSRVRMIRQAPLPQGMGLLLRVAACDDGAAAEAAALTGRAESFVAEAAAFFVEQILLDPDADSYRVLGSMPSSSSADLRRNMALLVRWLHPDAARGADRSRFAARVTYAWDDVKTPDRRSSYDIDRRSKQKAKPDKPMQKRRKAAAQSLTGVQPARGVERYEPPRQGIVQRFLIRLFRRET